MINVSIIEALYLDRPSMQVEMQEWYEIPQITRLIISQQIVR